jgi:hypothetical protein
MPRRLAARFLERRPERTRSSTSGHRTVEEAVERLLDWRRAKCEDPQGFPEREVTAIVRSLWRKACLKEPALSVQPASDARAGSVLVGLPPDVQALLGAWTPGERILGAARAILLGAPPDAPFPEQSPCDTRGPVVAFAHGAR